MIYVMSIFRPLCRRFGEESDTEHDISREPGRDIG